MEYIFPSHNHVSLNFTSTSTAPPHTFGSSCQSYQHDWTTPTSSLSRGNETPLRRGHICPIYPDTGIELSATIPGQAHLASADPANLRNMPGLRSPALSRAFSILPSSYHLSALPAASPTILLPPLLLPPFPDSSSADGWTRDRGSSLLCLAAFRLMLHAGRAYTAGAVSNSHPGMAWLSWAVFALPSRSSVHLPSNEGNTGASAFSHGTQGLKSSDLLSHSSFRILIQCYQIIPEPWLDQAVWLFKPIGLARWHIFCH